MNRIRQLRNELNWKQSYLAGKLHVKEAAISKYENEKVPLNAETIVKLCEIFNCSSDYLLGLSNIRSCNMCPFSANQGSKIIYNALSGTNLLSPDGFISAECEKFLTELLELNGKILSRLYETALK